MAEIRLQNVYKFFGERTAIRREQVDASHSIFGGSVRALDDVSLTIPDGQTLSVLGPSGCGKSTLLRVVAGLESGYEGQIFYDGRDVRDVRPGDRHIGMVFQNYALYPHFEGHGNLSFFFRMRKFTDAETEERIRITSDIMGIGFRALLQRKPGTLSGGQQQRVAIARAIVRNPSLFLFDEPLSNLDAKLRSQTRVEIKRLLRRFQITALYVTHDQSEAITLGDQVAVMRAGKVEQIGTYHELHNAPVNEFVAGFLGAPPMNLFRNATIEQNQLCFDSFCVSLPSSVLEQLSNAHIRYGTNITMGVRPEAAIQIEKAERGAEPKLIDPEIDDASSGPFIHIDGIVDVVEPDFARKTQLVYLSAGRYPFAAQCSIEQNLYSGNRMTAVFPADALYFFDGETGRKFQFR
ncbi:ATP-binding cassette domain-containing protein [Chloroflexi bacterium TSY]|nr:ATP-binding cassette domain-containing protein [Chloroflexi bacterium TSY]